MKSSNSLLGLIALTFMAASASAGALFTDSSPLGRQDPSEKMAFLIAKSKATGDKDARIQAIRELRKYDAVKYPQIVPALAIILRNDKSSGVRIEAARSLGRIRPLTSMAREALAHASLRDSAFRVRWQARGSLAVYTVARINPNNYPRNDAEQPPIDNKAPAIGPPSIGRDVPPFVVPVNSGEETPPYAKRLPKGPPQPVVPVRAEQNNVPPLSPIDLQPPIPPALNPQAGGPIVDLPLIPPPPANIDPRPVPQASPAGPLLPPPAS